MLTLIIHLLLQLKKRALISREKSDICNANAEARVTTKLLSRSAECFGRDEKNGLANQI